MKPVWQSLRMLFFMTLLTGVVYPLAVTVLGQVLFSRLANGSLIERGGVVVGSALVAQKFENPGHFWSRPSSVDQNPLPSGGSNLGPTSADLKKAWEERAAKFKSADPGSDLPPQDLLFASGSGIDPEISPAAAHYQVARVARVHGWPESDLARLVDQFVVGRQYGVLGEPRVNVLKLNLALEDFKPTGAKIETDRDR